MRPKTTPWMLSNGAVHVWSAQVNEFFEAVSLLRSRLTPSERERAATFHFERDRIRYIVARGLLRELLGEYIGIEPHCVSISYGPRGKPQIDGSDSDRPLHFNVSHSGTSIIFAFSRSCEMGVDVEMISRDPITKSLAARCLSRDELVWWDRLPDSKRPEAFCRMWVRKEAYLKGLGLGLALPPSAFSVSLRKRQSLPGRRDHFGRATRPWTLIQLNAEEGLAAALAVEGAPSETQVLHRRRTMINTAFSR